MAKIFRAVKFLKSYPAGLIKAWRIIFLFLGGLSLIGWALISLYLRWQVKPEYFEIPSIFASYLEYQELLLGLALITLPLGFSLVFFEIFVSLYLKEPPIILNAPALEYLDFQVAEIFLNAASLASSKKESISTNTLLIALAAYQDARPLWHRLSIEPSDVEKGLRNLFGYSAKIGSADQRIELDETVKQLTEVLNQLRQEHKGERISMPDVLIALFDKNQVFQAFLLQQNIDRQDLNNLGVWFETMARRRLNKKRFWQLENLLRQPPIGVDWVYGYTPLLNRYATDITAYFESGIREVRLIGRKEAIDQIEQVLSRAGENNVLLVGEIGVGKKTVAYGFADLVAKGNTVPALKYKRVLELNVSLLISGSQTQQEMENKLLQVLQDAKRAGNIILFIENLHNFVSGESGVGKLDISEVLKPYLELSNFQVISTTDPENFHKLIRPRADIMGLFERIDITEPDKEKTIQILQTVLPALEEKQKVFIPQRVLEAVVEKSDIFIRDIPFPEKAIGLLSEVIAHVSAQKRTLLKVEDVDKVITQKTHVPVGEIGASEKEKIQNLEMLMHQDIVNQEPAIRAVAQAMLRLRAGVTRVDKPAGVFLFVGPTGVGKTLTAKTLAKVYFGNEEQMIRFDMSEFQEGESIDRFIGSLRTNDPGQFVSKVRDNPFSVILLDEIEKSHSNILNLFLQVFDEGRLTDVFGKSISFRQNIIIATSNAAAEYIRELVQKGINFEQEKQNLLNYLLEKQLFRPEFLNRFDEVIVYHPLNLEQIRQIAGLLLQKLAVRLKQDNYMFAPNGQLIDYVTKIGFDPQFGVRPMQRAIQDTIEVVIARKILNKEVQRGVEFSIGLEELPK